LEGVAGVLQVNSVTPGNIGGAIFSGRVIGQRRILVCKADYRIITRVPQAGECWKFRGMVTKHDEYRDFVTIESCYLVSLQEAGYIKNFLLKHPSFRGFGFGAKKVEKLVDAFGADALVSALDNGKVSHLSEIVSTVLAEQILITWRKLSNETETIRFLVENKIPIELAVRILKVCSYDTVTRLKQNPYMLVAFSNVVPKIWRMLDELAFKLGIKKDDVRRLVGAVELSLYRALEQGNTASPVASLQSDFNAIVKTPELFNDAVKAAFEVKVACSIVRNGTVLIQPIGAAMIEQDVEDKIVEMSNSPFQKDLVSDIGRSIGEYSNVFENMYGFALNSEQKEAVKTALNSNISAITGFGGTGKTTVLRAIVELAGRPVYVLALSGKAKERAKESTGVDAYTIHSFISRVSSKILPVSGNPLIIIDEASMVDIALINRLFKVMGGNEFSLVTVGDTGQLSPVGFGLFWHSIVKSKLLPVVNLTEVHRTSSTQLHAAAMAVRGGSLSGIPTWNGETKGIYFVDCRINQKELGSTLVDLRKLVNPDHQIITPYMYDGAVDSGNAINSAIQFSVHQEGTPSLYLRSFWLKQGDPVIVTSNSYERELFNGNIGRLIEVVTEGEEVVGMFDFYGRTHYLNVADCWELGVRLAYAISIHKSQGSEYDTSIVCVVSDTDMLERSMLYTAITRSKNLTLLVGNRDVARKAAERPNRADALCVGFQACDS